MHETSDIEKELKKKALEIQKDLEKRGLGSPPVIIILGGIYKKRIDRTMFGSVGCRRLRDFLGILETTKQIATLRHFFLIERKSLFKERALGALAGKRKREKIE